MGNKVAVIGTGASGLLAAISAAEHGAEVTCFDSNDKVGRKILSTGNGRCNYSNEDFEIKKHYYASDYSLLEEVFRKFGVDQTKNFFYRIGMLSTQKNGYWYPYSNQAATVRTVLENRLHALKIKVLTDVKVTRIVKKENTGQFQLMFEAGEQADKKSLKNHYMFDTCILACGGKAAPATGSDGNGYELALSLGHTVTALYPALCGVCCEGKYFKQLAGVRAKAALSLLSGNSIIEQDTGELQLTDYGISGIPVFQISRMIAMHLNQREQADKLTVKIDFLPEYEEEEIKTWLKETDNRELTGLLHKKIVSVLLKEAGFTEEFLKSAEVKQRDFMIDRFVSLCKNYVVIPKQVNSFEQAQVTAGGIPLKEINGKMESKVLEGLFFCGEMLDVDGKCGGYNLQWAWSSGYVAGCNAAALQK